MKLKEREGGIGKEKDREEVEGREEKERRREERRGRKKENAKGTGTTHNSQPGRFQLCFGYFDHLLDTL